MGGAEPQIPRCDYTPTRDPYRLFLDLSSYPFFLHPVALPYHFFSMDSSGMNRRHRGSGVSGKGRHALPRVPAPADQGIHRRHSGPRNPPRKLRVSVKTV